MPDGSIFYDFTDKFRVGLEATNLTNSYTRQIMEQHAGNFTRQVFMSESNFARSPHTITSSRVSVVTPSASSTKNAAPCCNPR